MDDNTKLKLQMEQSRGAEYQRSWNTMVEPFVQRKKAELFEAFQDLPATTSPEDLLMVKLQCNALQSLEDEFRHYITTGQMAQQSLNEEEEKDG